MPLNRVLLAFSVELRLRASHISVWGGRLGGTRGWLISEILDGGRISLVPFG